MKKIVGALAVFVITYALFSAAGYLFPVDQEWYNSLKKPDWTPSVTAIGIIWATLFALISLSAAIVYAAFSFKGAKSFRFTLLINYVLNQAFSYFQFTQKNLLAASLDCLLVAITAIVLPKNTTEPQAIFFCLIIYGVHLRRSYPLQSIQ